MILSFRGLAQDDQPENRTLLVIDTDMGLDDIRAIALLLQQPKFRVLGIITSDGATDPVTGVRNLIHLLDEPRDSDGNELETADLLLGIGLKTDKPAPPFRARASMVFPGSDTNGAEWHGEDSSTDVDEGPGNDGSVPRGIESVSGESRNRLRDGKSAIMDIDRKSVGRERVCHRV